MRTEVLDHGSVELVESWGSDERIVEAARMSTAKGFQGWGGVEGCPSCWEDGAMDEQDGLYRNAAWALRQKSCTTCKGSGKKPGDEKLLKYLWDHKHATPFEMAGLIVEVQAPIFVFREWHRHRTQSYNELSARYTPLPDVNYIPTVDRLLMAGGANKQAQGTGGQLTPGMAEGFRDTLRDSYASAERDYKNALFDGVSKELARLMIPVGRYSRMRAAANLRNWLAFLTLRMDSSAQWEIRQYANAVGGMIAAQFPRTWELFIGG